MARKCSETLSLDQVSNPDWFRSEKIEWFKLKDAKPPQGLQVCLKRRNEELALCEYFAVLHSNDQGKPMFWETNCGTYFDARKKDRWVVIPD